MDKASPGSGWRVIEEGARFVSQILAGKLVGKPEIRGHENEKD